MLNDKKASLKNIRSFGHPLIATVGFRLILNIQHIPEQALSVYNFGP